MNAHDVLVGAKSMIADERRWFGGPQRVWPCAIASNCAITAIFRVSMGDAAARVAAVRTLTRVIGREYSSIPDWNNNNSHAEVMAGFDRAIASLRPTDITAFTDMLQQENQPCATTPSRPSEPALQS